MAPPPKNLLLTTALTLLSLLAINPSLPPLPSPVVIPAVSAKDSITFDYESVMEEIEGQDNKGDQSETIDGKRYSWMINATEAQYKTYEGLDGDNETAKYYMEYTTLQVWQNAFVRFKGFYEGAYKGFYRNMSM